MRDGGLSNQWRTDSTGGSGAAECTLMIERMRKRNAYDGPLGCEKPRRAVLFSGDLPDSSGRNHEKTSVSGPHQ